MHADCRCAGTTVKCTVTLKSVTVANGDNRSGVLVCLTRRKRGLVVADAFTVIWGKTAHLTVAFESRTEEKKRPSDNSLRP